MFPRILALAFLAAPSVPAAAAPAATAQPTWLDDLIHEVEEIRGLKAKRPIEARVVPKTAFLEALHAREGQGAEPRAELAYWLAFDFAAGDAAPKEILAGLRDEQVLGFYDRRGQVLWIRDDPSDEPPTAPPGAPAAWTPRALDREISRALRDQSQANWVLAHEITHALQDQWFDLGRLEGPNHDDQAVAYRSLAEGDAMLVTFLFTSRQGLVPADPHLSDLAALLAAQPELLVSRSGGSERLLAAPAIVRRELLFPYSEGFSFVERLHHTGGFALVDRAFAVPPRSTAQILHVADYVEGRFPAVVGAPPVLPGAKRVASGSLGELGIQMLLREAFPVEKARTLAVGVSGDAYTLGESPDRALSLQWVTVWATEQQASAFEAALRDVVARWKAVPAARGWTLPAGAQTQRIGDRVVLVRDLPGTQTVAALASLPGLAHSPPPPSPPLGAVKLAEESTSHLLSKERIRAVMKQHWAEVRTCYERGLQVHRDLHGKVSLAFTIDGLGEVSRASVSESSMNSSQVEDCIVSALRLWKFPKPAGGGKVQVTYPYVFNLLE